jgi:TetR/AcrR family transcriptional repressor of nem operon
VFAEGRNPWAHRRRPKPGSHDRILDIAAARIRRDGIESLSVAELMAEAGLTPTARPGRGGDRRPGRLHILVDRHLSQRHRDSPEAGSAVPALAEDVARIGGTAAPRTPARCANTSTR